MGGWDLVRLKREHREYGEEVGWNVVIFDTINSNISYGATIPYSLLY